MSVSPRNQDDANGGGLDLKIQQTSLSPMPKAEHNVDQQDQVETGYPSLEGIGRLQTQSDYNSSSMKQSVGVGVLSPVKFSDDDINQPPDFLVDSEKKEYEKEKEPEAPKGIRFLGV